MFNTLVERRDKIGRHWFSKVNPLDYFELEQTTDGLTLTFEDLALNYGLNETATSEYVVRYCGITIINEQPLSKSTLRLSTKILNTMVAAFQPGDKPENNLFEIRIRTQRDSGKWSLPVAVWLWYHADESRWQLVGVEHLD